MVYEITVPYLPKTWNAFATKHWRYYKAYKDQIHRDLSFILRTDRARAHTPLSAVRITFVLGYSTNRLSDIDAVCVKPHVDALVREGVLAGDDKTVLREFGVKWEKTKDPQTRIIIEPLLPQ